MIPFELGFSSESEERDAQSFSDTDRLQERPLATHWEQREENSIKKSIRHSSFENSQQEQRLNIVTPVLWMTLANSSQRSSDAWTFRGMVNKKRRYWHLEQDDDLHSLNQRDGDESKNYGYRDEAEESGSKCYNKATMNTTVARPCCLQISMLPRVDVHALKSRNNSLYEHRLESLDFRKISKSNHDQCYVATCHDLSLC